MFSVPSSSGSVKCLPLLRGQARGKIEPRTEQPGSCVVRLCDACSSCFFSTWSIRSTTYSIRNYSERNEEGMNRTSIPRKISGQLRCSRIAGELLDIDAEAVSRLLEQK